MKRNSGIWMLAGLTAIVFIVGHGSGAMLDDPADTDSGTFIETFDDHSNEGGWSFYTGHLPSVTYQEEGGNPGAFFYDYPVISFAPHPGTALGVNSEFTGNYRARNVTSLGIDLRSFNYDYDISNRYLTLILMNDAGTPYDTSDDWGAYCIGPDKVPSKYVPRDGTDLDEPGWVSYDFEIDAHSTGLPPGWKSLRYGSGAKGGGGWTKLVQDVSYVQFFYGDPTTYYVLITCEVGMDNPRITWE